MGVTLEQLLDDSGINSLKGEVEKTASEDVQVDLVSALRKQAEDAPRAIREEAARELSEKTAEILIIKQTMQEIDKLASLGVNSEEHQKLATFIKVALDKGHSEEEVAEFLKTAQGRLGRAVSSGIQRILRPAARAGEAVAKSIDQRELRLLRKKMISGNRKEVTKHLERLEGEYGRPAVSELLQTIKTEGTFLPSAATRMLPKGGKKYTIKGPTGTEHSVSAGSLKRYGIPAAAGGAGLAVGSRGGGDKRGKGVVVVKD